MKYFSPKKVCSKNDWLACKVEVGQTAKRYQQGSPGINWINKINSTIVLFMVDDTIDEEASEQLKMYCEAYFYGCKVKVVRPGDTITNKVSVRKQTKVKVPVDFLDTHKIG